MEEKRDKKIETREEAGKSTYLAKISIFFLIAQFIHRFSLKQTSVSDAYVLFLIS